MKNIIIFFFLLATFTTSLQAQEEAIYQHYLISPILLNPAAAGYAGYHQIQLNARVAWAGFEGAPKTYSATYNGPIGNSFGIGVGVLSDQASELTNNRVQLNFGFRFDIKEDWKFAAGFATELRQSRLSSEAMASGILQEGDRIIESYAGGRGAFDATLGVYTTYRDATFAGLTFNNLVRNRLDGIVAPSDDNSLFQYYTFVLGHGFDLYNLNATIEPSLAIRQIRNTTETVMMDFNLKASFLDDQLVAGLSYRTLGALGILLGTKLDGLDLYYSYDVSFQDSQQHHAGAHEVTLAFGFGKKTSNRRY